MSWWNMFLLGDIGQQIELHDHRDRLLRLRSSVVSKSARDQTQDRRIEQLEMEVLQLKAGVAALTEVLRKKQLATDPELDAAMEASLGAAERAATERQAARDAEQRQLAAKRARDRAKRHR